MKKLWYFIWKYYCSRQYKETNSHFYVANLIYRWFVLFIWLLCVFMGFFIYTFHCLLNKSRRQQITSSIQILDLDWFMNNIYSFFTFLGLSLLRYCCALNAFSACYIFWKFVVNAYLVFTSLWSKHSNGQMVGTTIM